ncbi:MULTISPECIES: hypothetical protein [Paenibacillus]|uniref:hypothetical protein n=1 Tax=Paenibacillus TaxID=44249 RepID=UPI00201D6611|nr:hypothetical protein [Paenibacillus amylolyticus]MCL6663473.1 hypothetical protein [Paenibacillus amylolyticus]
MEPISYPLIHKGYKNENTYIVTKTETEGQFNIYQLFDEYTDYATASDIRAADTSLKGVPDEEIIVAIPGENINAFLIMNHIDIHEIESFKLTLDEDPL